MTIYLYRKICILITIIICFGTLTGCNNEEASDTSDYNVSVDELKTSTKKDLFLPLIDTSSEDKIANEAQKVVENFWSIDLSDANSFINEKGGGNNLEISWLGTKQNFCYVAYVNLQEKSIVGMDRLIQSGGYTVSDVEKETYISAAKNFAQTSLNSDGNIGFCYIPKLPSDVQVSSVLVSFPDEALYVEIASDLSTVGYRFFSDNDALQKFLSERTQKFS